MRKKLKLFYHIPCPEKRTYSRSKNNLLRKCRLEAILALEAYLGKGKKNRQKNAVLSDF